MDNVYDNTPYFSDILALIFPLADILHTLPAGALLFWTTLASIFTYADSGVWTSEMAIKSRLIVTTVQVEPYYMPVSNQSVEFEGYIPDLLEELARRLRFQYTLRAAHDGEYGNKRPDGAWSGMVGELLDNEADVAAAPLFITEQRLKVVDFTEPFINVQGTVLLRKPLHGGAPYITAARDLINQSEIKYGTLNTGLLYWAFRNSNSSTYRMMWRRMKNSSPSTLTETNEIGIERVRHEKYAFVIPSTIGDYISEREPCDLITIDRFLMNRGYGLAARKDSHLTSKLTSTIRQMKRDGYLDRLYEKWWYMRSDCRNGVVSSKLYHSANGGSRTQLALIVSVIVSFGVLTL